MDDAGHIEATLQRLADRLGDPVPAVYDRLFAERPELEALFVGDRTGAVRGEMLAVVFEIFLDTAAGGSSYRAMIGSERMNHDTSLGVPPADFAGFFPLVASVVEAEAGFSPDEAAAWRRLLAAIAEL